MVEWLFANWLWVRIPLLSLKLKIWYLFKPRSFFTFRQTIEVRLTLKLVRDMIITYISIYWWEFVLNCWSAFQIFLIKTIMTLKNC